MMLSAVSARIEIPVWGEMARPGGTTDVAAGEALTAALGNALQSFLQ
jgi:hypothetical protein